MREPSMTWISISTNLLLHPVHNQGVRFKEQKADERLQPPSWIRALEHQPAYVVLAWAQILWNEHRHCHPGPRTPLAGSIPADVSDRWLVWLALPARQDQRRGGR